MSTATLMRLAVAVLSFSSLSWALTLTVAQPNTNCPIAGYTTIEAAVNAANPGDTVEVCPALYPEQVLITKPLTLNGLTANGVGRVLIQPATMSPVTGVPAEAVITVMNTTGVHIQNLAIDASNNGVSGCATGVAGIHFYNASGDVESSAISGALVSSPQTCPSSAQLASKSGLGVLVDSSEAGPFRVNIAHNSIHDYTRNGILANGAGITVLVDDNTISGVGPAIGIYQFGVFLENGTVGAVTNNFITEGLCGALDHTDCDNLRSEGVTLRAPGNGTIVQGNFISQAQSGIFINGGDQVIVRNNVIRNIQGMDGIDIQGSAAGEFIRSIIQGNTIANVTPVSLNGCGIWESPGTGVSGNLIENTIVNDAYCGVEAVEADHVANGIYSNTLYPLLDSDSANNAPPATEP